MSDKISAHFMYECRFKKWPHSLRESSIQKLEEFFSGDHEYRSHLDHKGKRYAQILLLADPLLDRRKSTYRCVFDYRVKSPVAEKWVMKEVLKVIRLYDYLIFDISTRYKKKILYLSKSNFQIESIATVSEVRKCSHFFEKSERLSKNYSLKKLREEEIDDVANLLKEEFTRKPAHGVFCTNKKFIDEFKTILRNELKNKHSHYTIKSKKNGEILGHFGAFLSHEDPFWSSKAGMHFCLHKTIQGQGLLDDMYSILFEEMSDNEINIFTGSTSHPAILKRAVKSGRKAFAVTMMRDQRCYELEHFSKILKIAKEQKV